MFSTTVKASYYCFITLSTIIFVDYVPDSFMNRDSEDSRKKQVICCLYVTFALAVLAMCFDLVQENVRAKFKTLGRNIGPWTSTLWCTAHCCIPVLPLILSRLKKWSIYNGQYSLAEAYKLYRKEATFSGRVIDLWHIKSTSCKGIKPVLIYWCYSTTVQLLPNKCQGINWWIFHKLLYNLLYMYLGEDADGFITCLHLWDVKALKS